MSQQMTALEEREQQNAIWTLLHHYAKRTGCGLGRDVLEHFRERSGLQPNGSKP